MTDPSRAALADELERLKVAVETASDIPTPFSGSDAEDALIDCVERNFSTIVAALRSPLAPPGTLTAETLIKKLRTAFRRLGGVPAIARSEAGAEKIISICVNEIMESLAPPFAAAVLSMSQREIAGALPFQKRVLNWLMECFSNDICRDGVERNHRFLEESLELVQSLGCTRSEAHQLVDYVFGRPVGEPMQELGGVMVTLSALASCHDMDLNEAGETELARVWSNIEKIRAKQLAKPKHSPLPSLPPTLNSGAAQLTKQFIIDVIRCHVWFKENWDQTQELTGLDRAADDILEEVPRAVDGGASTSRPFYGAECPSYPACNGGCGLGCTKEIEQARAVEGAAVREALEPFAKLAERSRTWERANHGDTRVVLTSPALQGGSATLSTKDFQRAESALSHHNSGDGK